VIEIINSRDQQQLADKLQRIRHRNVVPNADLMGQVGSIIADGQGSMKGQIFRIAHLGYFDFPDLFAVVAELELILDAYGYPVVLGAGVARVEQVYAVAIHEKETVNA